MASITTVTLPPAVIGMAYEAGIAISAATFSSGAVASGALPTGITLSSATDPRLIGTPTVEGTFTFTISGGGATSGTLTLTVYGTLGDAQKAAAGITPAAAAAIMWPLGNY